MKRLMSFVLVALLSLGVASLSLAQEGAAGGQPGGSEMQGKPEKKHKKKHSKKARKGKKDKDKEAAPAEGMK
jgi:hypothetical protein